MNKNEFVKEVAEKSGVSQKEIKAIIEAIAEVVEDALIREEKIDVRGLFVAEGKAVEAGVARNPKTGESIPQPAHVKATMKLSPIIRKSVKEKTSK